jgi:type IV pilus assembly protein PilC
MPIFTFSAVNKAGNTTKGEREAGSRQALAQTLKQEGLFLLDAQEKGTKSAKAGDNWNLNLDDFIGKLRPIKLTDKMFFARNLAVMIKAGLSLTRAIDALAEQTSNPKFKKILADVNDSVTKGTSFADSLRPHEKVFSSLFVNMVAVGEVTGKLTLVLKLLGNQMKKDSDLKKRVRGAMIYPAIILSVLVIVGILMMIYVIPTLTQTILELGVELPFTTKIVIGTSNFIQNYILLVIGGVILLSILFWRALKTVRGKTMFDHFALKVPIFGSIIQNYNTARFCRTLAYLITSGVAFVKSLEITETVLGNTLFKDATRRAAAEVQKGRQLHEIMTEYKKVFQPITIQMVAVGEETGKVADMLLRLALFFEEDVTNTTKNLSSVIEPVLMVVIGAAVGFFAISMLQPIYGSLGGI